VIGTFLVFPLRIIHVIPGEEKTKKEKKKEEEKRGLPQTSCGQMRTQQGVKRNRAQAQKSIRVKHQKNVGAKKEI